MAFESFLPKGIITASLTPMHADLRVNYPAFINHLQWLLNNGCDAVCILGTTGEANSFSLKERLDLIAHVAQCNIEPHRLLVGSGCCSFPETVELTKAALDAGAGGILMLPPFYYKNPTDEGLAHYFDRVIENVNDDRLKIYLYHFPSMSLVPFSIPLVLKLATKYPNIVVGMKDSSGDWGNMKRVLSALPGFRLYAGTEKYLLDVLRSGGAGCITASGNVLASMMARVKDRWQEEGVDQIQNQLSEARLAFEGVPFAAGLKYMFAEWTGHKDWLNIRPPNHIPEHGFPALRERVFDRYNLVTTYPKFQLTPRPSSGSG